jgi:hypothetical protein
MSVVRGSLDEETAKELCKYDDIEQCPFFKLRYSRVSLANGGPFWCLRIATDRIGLGTVFHPERAKCSGPPTFAPSAK